jgi:Spy/CpxP family protein refolding chaperone
MPRLAAALRRLSEERMLKINLSALLVLPSLLLAMFIAAAFAEPPPDKSLGERPILTILSALGLSDAQRGELRRVFAEHRRDAQEMRGALRARVADFAALDPGSERYAADLQSFGDHAADSARSRTYRLAAVQREVFAILTAPQREKLIGMVRDAQFHALASEDVERLMSTFDQLQLSASQRERLRAAMQAHQQSGHEDHARRQAHILAFLTLDPGADAYPTQVRQLAETFAEDARRNTYRLADLQREVFAVLTAEQRAQLVEIIRRVDAAARQPDAN